MGYTGYSYPPVDIPSEPRIRYTNNYNLYLKSDIDYVLLRSFSNLNDILNYLNII